MTASNHAIATWARRSVDALLILLVVGCLLTVVLARGIPLTGRSTFVVAGGSMAPAIAVGSAVVAEPVDPTTLRVGDVVSLRSGQSQAVFTHRIVRVADQDGAIWIETKGDANAAADPSLTPATAVIGRVAIAIPVVGYGITLLSTISGVIFVISLGLILFLAGGLFDGRRSSAPRPNPAAAPRRDDVATGAIDAT